MFISFCCVYCVSCRSVDVSSNRQSCLSNVQDKKLTSKQQHIIVTRLISRISKKTFINLFHKNNLREGDNRRCLGTAKGKEGIEELEGKERLISVYITYLFVFIYLFNKIKSNRGTEEKGTADCRDEG